MDQKYLFLRTTPDGHRSGTGRTGCPKRKRKASILIIEAEALVAMELCSQLADLGHRIVGVAITAASALDLALETAPDAVIVGASLADQSAVLKAVREIRHVWPHLAAIRLAEQPEKNRTSDEQFHVLAKPSCGKTLSNTIGKLVAA